MKKIAETCGRVVSVDGVTKITDPVQIELGRFFQKNMPRLVALLYWKPMLRDCLVTPTDLKPMCTLLSEMWIAPPPSKHKWGCQLHTLTRDGDATSIILGDMGMPPTLSSEMWDATFALFRMGMSFVLF